jgi:hypothetical protein
MGYLLNSLTFGISRQKSFKRSTMRKIVFVLILSTITLPGMIDANACGDKTLRVGRGIRFHQMFASRHPSAILIYSPAIPGGKAAQLSDYLRKVGHRPYAVYDVAHLSEALKSGHYDLVLSDLAEADNLQKQAASSSPRTAVVPVVYKRSKAEEAATARHYKFIVKNPTNGDDFLAAIYQVMKSKTSKA